MQLLDQPGTYCLTMYLTQDTLLKIGSLADHHFLTGHYVYVGSALNGLMSRLRHHLKINTRSHWHVDYLRHHAFITDIWYAYSSKRMECLWSSLLINASKAKTPIIGFGSSDCKCRTHLTFFLEKPLIGEIISPISYLDVSDVAL